MRQSKKYRCGTLKVPRNPPPRSGLVQPFIRFHKTAEGFRHPALLGGAAVEDFLTHLAVERHVSASTQNQALNALLFLYRDVLRLVLSAFDALRASHEEMTRVLDAVSICRPKSLTA
jgi:hypothetical protein